MPYYLFCIPEKPSASNSLLVFPFIIHPVVINVEIETRVKYFVVAKNTNSFVRTFQFVSSSIACVLTGVGTMYVKLVIAIV